MFAGLAAEFCRPKPNRQSRPFPDPEQTYPRIQPTTKYTAVASNIPNKATIAILKNW